MRGEIWTIQAPGYPSKPRPAVIVQSDDVIQTDSVVVCMFTTSDTVGGATRVAIAASEETGLIGDSVIMAEKPVSIRRDRLGRLLGMLSKIDLLRVDEALRVALDL